MQITTTFHDMFNARYQAVAAANQLDSYITADHVPLTTLGETAKARAFLDYDVEYQPHVGVSMIHAVIQGKHIVIPTRRGWVAVDIVGNVVFSEHYDKRLDAYFDATEVATVKVAIAKAIVCGLSLKGLLIYLDNCDNRPMSHYFDVLDHMNIADLMTDGKLSTDIMRQKLFAPD